MITCFISKLAVKHVKYYYKDKLSHKTDLQGIQSILSYYKYILLVWHIIIPLHFNYIPTSIVCTQMWSYFVNIDNLCMQVDNYNYYALIDVLCQFSI